MLGTDTPSNSKVTRINPWPGGSIRAICFCKLISGILGVILSSGLKLLGFDWGLGRTPLFIGCQGAGLAGKAFLVSDTHRSGTFTDQESIRQMFFQVRTGNHFPAGRTMNIHLGHPADLIEVL